MTNVHTHHFIRQWKKTIFLYSIIQRNIEPMCDLVYHQNNNQSYLYLSSVISILRIQLYQWSKIILSSIITYSMSAEVKIVSLFPTSRSPLLGNLKTEQKEEVVFLTVEWLSQGNWQFRPRWPPVLNSSPRETAERIPTRLRSLHQFPRNVLPARPSG